MTQGTHTLRKGHGQADEGYGKTDKGKAEGKIKGKGASIDFEQGGRIFKEHHMGQPFMRPLNRNVPMRSIFPKSYASVPDDILHDTKLVIAEALSGNY